MNNFVTAHATLRGKNKSWNLIADLFNRRVWFQADPAKPTPVDKDLDEWTITVDQANAGVLNEHLKLTDSEALDAIREQIHKDPLWERSTVRNILDLIGRTGRRVAWVGTNDPRGPDYA